MKIAVLADIHSNHIAFETCIAHARKQGIETFLFLGDYVGEMAYPQKTMRMIYELKEKYMCYFIRGNKEEYWLNYRKSGENGWSNKQSTTGMLLYAYNQLTQEDFAFYESMPIAMEVQIENIPKLKICHGSPRKVNELLFFEEERTKEVMDEINTPVILCGHTHVQGQLAHNGNLLLNPGSVGISFLSQGKAQYMILHMDSDKVLPEFLNLPYDTGKVIEEMKEEKLYERAPYWSYITEQILRGVPITHGRILNRAMELCREEVGVCNWPEIPEIYYEMALKERKLL